MLAFFPDPYMDELLYGVCSRYHLWSGNLYFRDTVEDLFGSGGVKPVIDLPSHIDALVSRLPTGANYTSESLIHNHTLYPFYAPFLSLHRAEQIMSDMRGNCGGGIHTRAGIMAGGVCVPTHLKFCPECVKSDYEQFGEPYWHRLHQSPGVSVCLEHRFFLRDSCPICNKSLSNGFIQEFKALSVSCPVGHNLIHYEYEKANSEDPLAEHLIHISQDIAFLFTSTPRDVTPEALTDLYINLLQFKGLATPSGRVRLRQVSEEFVYFYGPDILAALESSVIIGDDHSWLATAFRKPRKVLHPIRHLLIMRFLTGSVFEFWKHISFKYRPFGNAPWPCLNPVAGHYGENIIDDISISICSDTSLPVGTFTCSCGFIYSRRGPDKTVEDRFRVGRIKSFGPVWEKRLVDIITNTNQSIRSIAEIMQADPGTIKKYIEKLHPPFRQISKECEITVDCQVLLAAGPINQLEKRRSRLLEVIQQLNYATRSQIRKAIPSDYTWLYRHDRAWLERTLPPPMTRGHRNENRERVNWKRRDEELYKKVEKAAEDLLVAEGKPIRITLARIGRMIDKLAILERHLDCLPKTKILLSRVTESQEDFQIRRIQWVVREIRDGNEELTEWKIMRKAGLSSNITPKVRYAIEYEMRKQWVYNDFLIGGVENDPSYSE